MIDPIMNPLAMLRDALAANPFEPFVVNLSDGRTLHVKAPDFLTISSKGNWVVYEGEAPQEWVSAMAIHIVGIEKHPHAA